MSREEELAIVDAATEGPWDELYIYWALRYADKHDICSDVEEGMNAPSRGDEKFIAHFNPDRVREMLKDLELLKVYMALVIETESVSFVEGLHDYRPKEQRPTEEQLEALHRIEKEVRGDERFGL